MLVPATVMVSDPTWPANAPLPARSTLCPAASVFTSMSTLYDVASDFATDARSAAPKSCVSAVVPPPPQAAASSRAVTGSRWRRRLPSTLERQPLPRRGHRREHVGDRLDA